MSYSCCTIFWLFHATNYSQTINCGLFCCYVLQIVIHIISKTTGTRLPIEFKAPFGFVFHFVNCYEDSGFVVCDLSLYEHADAIRNLYLSAICCDQKLGGLTACFVRFVLPLSVEGVSSNFSYLQLQTSSQPLSVCLMGA